MAWLKFLNPVRSAGIGLFLFAALSLMSPPPASAETTLSWTDSNLQTTDGKYLDVKPEHFRELRRNTINKRALCGLSEFNWTDGTITPKSTPIRGSHVTELRQAIKDVYDKAPARPIMTFTDPTIIPGETMIRATHVYELRQSIQEATCCGDGTCDAPYEDAATCIQDCGGCAYSDWVYYPCGDGSCLDTEVLRAKINATVDPACPEIRECVSDFSTCCAYGPWQYDSCGGAPCDPTAERQKRVSALSGCPVEYQCLANNSCCSYAGYNSGQCGYTGYYPDTTWVEVNEPANPACLPQFQGELPFADACCDYGPAVENCGGTIEGTTYDNSYYISQRVPSNPACPVDSVIVPDTEACCTYGAEEIHCGGTFRVGGVDTVFPDTTYLKIRRPTNPNCNVLVIDNIPYLDTDPSPYCCNYTNLAQCGYTSPVGFTPALAYPSNTWVQISQPTNPNCPIRVSGESANDDFCCAFTTTTGCGNGTTKVIGAAPLTDYITLKEPTINTGSCSSDTTISFMDTNCCGYPATWTTDCGYPSEGYDDTYLLDYKVPSNPACPVQFQNISGPFHATCCEWVADPYRCGGTFLMPNGDIVNYPDTTQITGIEIPNNNDCPIHYTQIIPESPYCCGYTDFNTCGDGIEYPVIDSLKTQIPEDGKDPLVCPVIIDQHVVEGCCGYPPNEDVDKDCGGTYHTVNGDVTYPATDQVTYRRPTNPLCFDKVLDVDTDAVTCCEYSTTATDQCGYTGYYPVTTELDVKESAICDPLFSNITEQSDKCCDYIGHVYSACGALGYPNSSWITWKESVLYSTEVCPKVFISEETNSTNCCAYLAPESACGGTTGFEGFSSTHWITRKVPGSEANSACTTIYTDNGLNATNCCGYPSTYTEGCGGSIPALTGTGFSSTTYYKRKIATTVSTDCPALSAPGYPLANATACCGYDNVYDAKCGYNSTGITGDNPAKIWPASTYVQVDVPDTNTACLLKYKNAAGTVNAVNAYYESCCSYSDWAWTCGCTNCYGSTTTDPAVTTKTTYPNTTYVEVRTSTKCATPQARNATAMSENCCHYNTEPAVDYGCEGSYTSTNGTTTTCSFGQKLWVNFATNTSCPAQPQCVVDATCSACSSQDEPITCAPVGGCPYERVCSGGVWTNCQPVSLCTPGTVTDYTDHCGDGTKVGYPFHSTCNTCGSGWGTCYCIPQTDVAACTTIEGCSGLASCLNGAVYDTCQPRYPVCTPPSTQNCTMPSGLPGKQECNTCGEGYTDCHCPDGYFINCTTPAGCSGAKVCDADTGLWNTTCVIAYPLCEENATRDCDPDGSGPLNATQGTQTCSTCQDGWSTCVPKSPN